MTVYLNGQTVLEEEFDVNHLFTEMEIQDYAKWLEVDIRSEPYLLPLVIEGIKAPLPSEWKPCEDETGQIYYFNFLTGQSVWDHPCDIYYKNKIKNQRRFNLIYKSKRQDNKGLHPHDLFKISTSNPTSQSRKIFQPQKLFLNPKEKTLPVTSENQPAIKLLNLTKNLQLNSEHYVLESKVRFDRYDVNLRKLPLGYNYINNACLKIAQNVDAHENQTLSKQKSIKKRLEHSDSYETINESINSLNFKSEMNQDSANNSVTEANNFENYSQTKLSNKSSFLEPNSSMKNDLIYSSIDSHSFEEINSFLPFNENQVKNRLKICSEKNLIPENSNLPRFRYECYDSLKINPNILLVMGKFRKLNKITGISQNRLRLIENITIQCKQIPSSDDVLSANSRNAVSIDSLSFKNDIKVHQADTFKTRIHLLLPNNYVKQIMQDHKYKERENKCKNRFQSLKQINEFYKQKLNELESFSFKRERESNILRIKIDSLGSNILLENIPYQREYKIFEQRTNFPWMLCLKDRMNCFDVNFENNKLPSTVLSLNSHCINWDEMSRKLAEIRFQTGCIHKNVVSKCTSEDGIDEKIKTYTSWLKEAQMYMNTHHN